MEGKDGADEGGNCVRMMEHRERTHQRPLVEK